MAIPKLIATPVVAVHPPLTAARFTGRDARSGRERSGGDGTSFLGLSEEELTPNVRIALAALLEEAEGLRGELAAMRGRVQELGRLADEDSLLPMANRRAFLRELARMTAFARRYGSSVCLLFFDVDDLKRVNDTHGHAAGDAGLRRIADIIVANVRGSDVVGRLGGDEIGVIMAHCDLATAKDKAESLVALVEAEPLAWQGHAIPLSLSVGVCPFTGSETAADLLAAADRAMYQAKGRAAK